MMNLNGLLAVQLLCTWASFSPLLPLLTGPKHDGNTDHYPSPVPQLLCVFVLVAGTSAAASSTMLKLASPRGFKRRATVERGLVGLVLGALTIHAVMIMLGAPLIRSNYVFSLALPCGLWLMKRNFRKTLASSLLLAAMTSLPVWISTESPLEACLETLIGARPLIRNPASSVPAMGCAVGAWLGAVPLILDWNEPWQAWPLTVALGGLLGFSAGIILFLAKWIVSLGARWRRGDQQAKLS